ncbi:MAG: response regulator [Verrucomicrobia bacterium]|nr:response regulator [Verrucomicrobiota bacterium]
MSARPKILLLDDEQDLLDMYKEILAQLPSHPEIHLANSGARAIALLEAEPFTLLISDLRMPKMDGLQVLSIVRRKFPDLRVVVMTSITDEQYRSRAYAMGVDLFWVKPGNGEEMKMFQDCIASLLGQDVQSGGFRGVQSKGLVDIIQLECLSRGSSVLKIVNGTRDGRIWVCEGDIVDAQCGDLSAHAAFKEMLSWRTGAFEILPADLERTRTIFENYQGLLLDSAQSLDEAGDSGEPSPGGTPLTGLAALSRVDGVEFIVEVPTNELETVESWGVKNAEPYAKWTRESWKSLCELGEKLHVGDPVHFHGLGWQGHVGLDAKDSKQIFVGFARSLNSDQIREKMNLICSKWVS